METVEGDASGFGFDGDLVECGKDSEETISKREGVLVFGVQESS